MEEGRCRRLTGGSRVGDLAGGAATAAFYDEYSLEEDSAGQGYPWPPRSYSCSFCRREFRSAQALGGHVNVHRRDRARLKLSSATQIEIGLRQIPCPPGVSVGTSRSPSSSSFRVSGTSTIESPKEQILVSPSCLSHFFNENPDESSVQIPMGEGDLKEKAPGGKRRKHDLTVPHALRFSVAGESLLQSQTLGGVSIPAEEIDLELRLGGSAFG
ncbi:unnamed protein product [Spirodela intermedia]|uniref:C2H2-type domain-containing protein n=1 Tax=Spirodela intermedia TaxID=51605 RepID=A0A7I8K5C4_SPIIN|nr:unnamed protein product [Spirodela intermedia]CAA7392734.1 unnamed protein product [Spirodela intermedia]